MRSATHAMMVQVVEVRVAVVVMEGLTPRGAAAAVVRWGMRQ